MLSVKITKTASGDEVSCVLQDDSLSNMRELEVGFRIGWIASAMGRWIARSNWPESKRIYTDAISKSLQTFLPSFTDVDVAELMNLPCFTSRANYLLEKARETPAALGKEVVRENIGLGFGSFQFFDSKKTPDLTVLNEHLKKHKRYQVVPSAEPS